MPKVTAKATYCGHTLHAETDLDRHGQWAGRCVVDGPDFKRTVMLYTSYQFPTAALDALLTEARQWIDAERGGEVGSHAR